MIKSSKRLFRKGKGFTLTELAFSVAIMSIISIAVSTLLTASYQAQVTHRTSALVESISMNFTEQLRRDARLATGVSIGGSFSRDFGARPADLNGTGNTVFFFYRDDANGRPDLAQYVAYSVDNARGQILRQATYNPETRQAGLNPVQNTMIFVGQQRNGQEDVNGLVGRCLNLGAGNNNSGNNVPQGQNCFSFNSTELYRTNNPQIPGQQLISRLTRVTVNGLQIGPDPNDPTPIIFPVDAFGRPVYNIRQTSFELGGAKIFR